MLKLVYYRCYIGDIFVLFKSHEHLLLFRNSFNSKHLVLKCPFEKESNNKTSFLDVDVSREYGSFNRTVYPIPTFSSAYIHFNSVLLMVENML